MAYTFRITVKLAPGSDSPLLLGSQFLKNFYFFIYLFLTALHFSGRTIAFSSFGEQGIHSS